MRDRMNKSQEGGNGKEAMTWMTRVSGGGSGAGARGIVCQGNITVD